MAIKDTKNAETTDRASEGEKKETPDPEQPREPILDKAADQEDQQDKEDQDVHVPSERDETDEADASDDTDEADEADEAGHAEEEPLVSAAPGGGFAAGSAAVVSAGLALCSLVGTPLSDMLRSREELIGQIESSTGGGGDQIDAFYSAPWHTAALVNGIFALVAVVVGGVLLAAHARRADTRPWVKAVALGGVVLGGLGLIVAGGMYFDLFANAPELPSQPS